MTYKALLMDFDGVIIESNDAKTEAFAELFASYPGHAEAMMSYHLDNIYVSRVKKFEYYVYELLGRPSDRQAVDEMAERFASLVFDKVLASPEVPGARRFLEEFAARLPIYLSSATPEPELNEILRERRLRDYFTGVFGDPPCLKSEAIRRILSETGFSPREILFIGDSLGDFRYANDAGLAFIGRDSGLPLTGVPDVYTDFSDIGDALRAKLQEGAA